MTRLAGLLACVAIVGVSFGGGRGQDTSIAERPLELAPLIEAGMRDSPELAALRSRIDAAEAGVLQAGALPDPQFGVALSNFPIGKPQISCQTVDVGVGNQKDRAF